MEDVKDILAGVVGSENVSDELHVRATYSRDTGVEPPVLPGIVVRPRSTAEVSRIVQVANMTNTPIWLRGGGAGTAGGGFPILPGGIMLDMTSMRRVTEINEEQLSVTVECGITWSALDAELEKKGYYVGYQGPESGLYATVGGSISLSSPGFNSAKFGSAGPNVISLEVVLPTGDVVRTGSAAHPQQLKFTRYVLGPDLTGLFIGDQGCYGIKCKATLPLRMRPTAFAYTTHLFDGVKKFAKAATRIRAYCYIHHGYYYDDWGTEFAFPNVAKEHEGEYDGGIWLLKAAGDDEHYVEKQAQTFNRICEEEKGKNLSSDISKGLFDMGWDVYPASAKIGQWQFLCSQIPVSTWPKLQEVVHNVADKWKLRKLPGVIGVVLGGVEAYGSSMVFCPCVWFDGKITETANTVRNFFYDVSAKLFDAGASPYYILKMWAPHMMWKLGQYFELMRTIKRTLDPNNILEPGMLMLPTGYSGYEASEPGLPRSLGSD